jgi:hypothetical protein
MVRRAGPAVLSLRFRFVSFYVDPGGLAERALISLSHLLDGVSLMECVIYFYFRNINCLKSITCCDV